MSKNTLNEAIDDAGAASDDAHEKIRAQRAKLAAMSRNARDRSTEEINLQTMIETAKTADMTLTASMDEEESAEGKAQS